MKGEKFMAISYTYPRVDVNTTALTRRVLNETIDDTIVMLSIFNSKCGPIDTISRIHGISQFESIYGSVDDDVLDNTGLNIRNWLSNGGTVYAMRHVPTSVAAEAYYNNGTGANISIIPGVNSHMEIPGNETKKINIFKSYHQYVSGYHPYGQQLPYTMLVKQYIGDDDIYVILGALHLRYTGPQDISGEKVFPVYFPIKSDGEIDFNGALPFQLYSIGYKISFPIKGDILKTCYAWYDNNDQQYNNDDYRITGVGNQQGLAEHFEEYFEEGASDKLNENYISLPQPMITITNIIDGEEKQLPLSDVGLQIAYPGSYAEKVFYNNIAYEGKFSKDSYWSIDLGDKINNVYDKTLKTDDVFQNIFKLAILNANSVESVTNRTPVLTDYVSDDGYIISLDAIAFVNSPDDIDNVKMSLNNPAVLFSADYYSSYDSYDEWDNLSKIDPNVPIKSMFGAGFGAPTGNDGESYQLPMRITGYYTTITIKHPTKIISKITGSGYNNLNLKILATGNQINYKLAMGQDLIEIGNMNNISNLENPDNIISDYFYIEDGFLKENLFEQHLMDTVNDPRLSNSLVGLQLSVFRPRIPPPFEIIPVIRIQKSDLLSIVTDLLLNESKFSDINANFKFSGGTDQIIVNNEGNADSSPQSLTVYSALKTEKTKKLLMNTLEFPIDIFFDAGYSAKTKKALYDAFCSAPTSDSFIRSDVNVILDSFFIDDRTINPTRAIYSAAEDSVDGGQQINTYLPKTSNTKNLSVYEQYFKIALNNTQIVVSPTYFLSKNIAYYDISLGYGTHAPIAGMKRGLIENYKYINKQYLPDSAQELFESDVNYATVYRNGTAFMSQRTREDDSQNTALQFFNNSFTTNRIVKELERIARAYLFEYNDAVSISNLRKTLNQYIGRYVSDRVLTYAMLDVQKDDFNPEQINIALNIKFNNSVEVIEVNLVIE